MFVNNIIKKITHEDTMVGYYQRARMKGYRRHGAHVVSYIIDPDRRQAVDRLAGLHADTDR